MNHRIILSFLTLSIMIFGCNESASSKINPDNKLSIQKENNYAEITFDKVFHDFGFINEGEIVETIFKFTNTSENDLYITDAIGSCGCTVPKYPKNVPIRPGETGEIEVNFDTNGRPDLQQKMVKVSANTSSGGKLLRIQAFVEPKIN